MGFLDFCDGIDVIELDINDVVNMDEYFFFNMVWYLSNRFLVILIDCLWNLLIRNIKINIYYFFWIKKVLYF